MEPGNNKSSFKLKSGNKPSPTQLSGVSPMKSDKIKRFEVKPSEMETLKKTGEFTRKEATQIAKESTVLPEIEIKAKRPKIRYTKKDLDNASTGEIRGAIIYHAKKHGYKLK